MNVAQELGDDELYDYDILVKLLGDRFDPASLVSASRSRFHGDFLRRRHYRTMPGWLPTELAGAPPGVDQSAICARTIGSGAQKVLVGGDSYPEGLETPDID